jgi:EAL domain-containing protein (putative c-di-GMP-specific phosphodiesterase class I)
LIVLVITNLTNLTNLTNSLDIDRVGEGVEDWPSCCTLAPLGMDQFQGDLVCAAPLEGD